MNLENNIILNVFSIALLAVIHIHSSKHGRKSDMQSRIFVMMLQITILLLVLDVFSRFDGKPDTMYPLINHAGNYLVFLLNPVLSSIWLYYVHALVNQEKGTAKRLFYLLLAVNGGNAALITASQFFGWFYRIDSNNIYHRGPFFFFLVLLTFAMITAAFVMLLTNRNKMPKREYYSLLFFAIPPLAGIFLQFIFYGMSLMLNFTALSLLIVFLNVQNNDIHTDYLTGVHNRKKLEAYMHEKIDASRRNRTFAAIMIDIDNFKAINDAFGHEAGDNALKISAKLLSRCLRANDLIARYGGDEFYIILDVSDRTELEQIVERINRYVEKYNESSGQPYKLSFSMGYDVYDCPSGMTLEEFQKKIDVLMYDNKQANRDSVL